MSDDQTMGSDVEKLRIKIQDKQLPVGLREKVDDMINRLEKAAQYGKFSEQYETTSHYIDWISQLPWGVYSQDRINLDEARQLLDQHHYGLESVKQRMLEFLSVIKLKQQQNQGSEPIQAPIVCLVGLAGTGKTTFAYALAEAMGRKIARIPFGGMGSARDLRGQSRLHLEAEPGHVIKALRDAGTNNPIILLDEIDRVAQEARSDIMGVLLELLDPGQNKNFVDHYIDYPVNLNPVMFIATANNTDNVSTAVANRLEIIHMPTYTDEEKIIIGKNYVLPNALKEAGLPPNALIIDDEAWPLIVRPLGFDSGIRILKRNLDNLARKIAFMVVSGQTNQIHMTEHNIAQYIDQY